MHLETGTKVKIISIPEKYAKPGCMDINGSIGTIEQYWCNGQQYGVRIEGAWNKEGSSGLYWLKSNNMEVINIDGGIDNMAAYNHVAIVNLVDDKKSKDYGFAVYDEDMECLNNILENKPNQVYLIVNARNKYSLAKLKDIVDVETYLNNNDSRVTKEVICFCNDINYNNRIKQRKEEIERKAKEMKLRAELDSRIAKLKNMEYYKRMADELGSRDSELKSLVDELVKVSGE